MNKEYKLDLIVKENKSSLNNIETFELHFNSYEESLHLKFFNENGNQEEFLNIVNYIILNKTLHYFNFKLPKKISCLKKHFYSQENKFYLNNHSKTFSTSKHYRNSNITTFLLFDKDIFKDDLKRLRIKLNKKEDSIENIFEHNIDETFTLALSKFGYYKNHKKNIVFFDKWGSIAFKDQNFKLLSF